MIDRRALVGRHDPSLSRIDPDSPLSVGNGEFSFTADATGMQTFLPEAAGSTPLCTMSQWGWHSYGSAEDLTGHPERLRLQRFDAGGRDVGYMTDPSGQEDLFNALRVNAHRLNLARIAFVVSDDGTRYDSPKIASLSGIDQRLNLWEGRLSSSFALDGTQVRVETVVHPRRDAVSFRVESALLSSRRLGVMVSFPYGSHLPDASDWASRESHATTVANLGSGDGVLVTRALDKTVYRAGVRVDPSSSAGQYGAHEVLVASRSPVLELTVEFAPDALSARAPSWAESRDAARAHWESFWGTGGALELAESPDPRALELERRVVLSRYLTAIQCAGSTPPQETGLTCNSWYGKFHLEMHYWHSAHFAQWGNADLLARSLDWYRSALGKAKSRAASQGYRGARWPKMTDPRGDDSPSAIGPLLCWQEPHPIMYAELLRRSGADRATLESCAELVFETAEFMADYARLVSPGGGGTTERYILGPPLIPAQESHKPMETQNPAFELEYWRWGLETAIAWTRRELAETGGLSSNGAVASALERWQRVLSLLSVPATGTYRDGRKVYLAHELCPRTFESFAVDHPSMLLALGMLPGASVDPRVMSATLDAVLDSWNFGTSWGWDFPAIAMTAARLGRRRDAVDALMMDTPKNTWRANGHNAQITQSRVSGEDSPFLFTTALPLYLPGNGALLLAAGMMAAGWGSPDRPSRADGDRGAPGFPDDGSWIVRAEGIMPLP